MLQIVLELPEPPHPNPLPNGERVCAVTAIAPRPEIIVHQSDAAGRICNGDHSAA